MKLIIVLLTTCLMQVSAAGFAQRLSYSKKNATLEEIFKQITLQTGYNVLYSPQKIEESKKIDVNFKNTDLKDALDQITKNQKLEYTIDSKNIIIKPEEPSFIDNIIAQFQSIDVRGKVVDSLGVGIAGATVSVKNGKGSTSTSANGDFYLKNIEEGSVLVISFMGYVTKEQTVSKEFNFVTLKQSTSHLDEVLVQAYGTTTRRLSTGNIAMITSKEIAQQNINNPLLALQGRVAGVEITQLNGMPGGPINVRIRGEYTTTIGNQSGEGNDPLIVIDGVPFTNNIIGLGSAAGTTIASNGTAGQLSALSLINTNDIESISILKDADATSIYGSRGSKGVILINTKKGKVGQTAIDIVANSGWQDVPKKLSLLNTNQYLEMRKEALKNDNRLSRLDNPTRYASSYPELLVWDQYKNTDWQEVLLGETGEFKNIQSTISGGSDMIQYRVGGTFQNESYVWPGDLFDKKGSLNLSVSGTSANQKFRASFSAGYLVNKNKSAPIDFTRDAMNLAPNAPNLYTATGELNWAPNPYSPTGAVTWFNPLAQLERPLTQDLNTLISNAHIGYEIYPGLSIGTGIGYTKLSGDSFSIESSSASSIPNMADYPFLRYAFFRDTGTESWSVEPQLNYKTNLIKGKLDVLIGGSGQMQSSTTTEIGAYGFNSDDVMKTLSLATGYNNLGNTTSEYKYSAVFGRLTYDWDQKYLINLTARRDGSSRFGPDRQFGNFWSLGTAWIFSQEKLINSLFPFLSLGKIRFSYGTSGNDGIGDNQYLELYSPVTDIEAYRGIKLLNSSGVANTYFGWETVKKMEFGLNLAFFQDRLDLSTVYFRNRSTNLLNRYQLARIAGPANNFTTNNPALIQTSGWEFQANSVNLSSTNFRWITSLNLSCFSKNKLLADNDGDRTKPGLGEPFYGNAGLYTFYGVDAESGQYQFLGKDGQPIFFPTPETSVMTNIRIDPIISGGLNNSLIYKNLSLDIFLQFIKQNGRNPLFQFDNPPGYSILGMGNQLADVMERWKISGDKANFQRFTGGALNPVPEITLADAYKAAANSTLGWVDASFIRLKTVSLSYSPANFAKQKLRLKNIRVFAQGQNIFTWTRYKGRDPQIQTPYALPPLRTLTAGIQITL